MGGYVCVRCSVADPLVRYLPDQPIKNRTIVPIPHRLDDASPLKIFPCLA